MFVARLKQCIGAWRGSARPTTAALVTAACASAAGAWGPAISYAFIEPVYSPYEVSYAADGRDLAVVVHGNPFSANGVTDDALGDAVVAAMQDHPGWFVTNFTTNPGESARELYRVVWLVGVAPETSIYRICGPRRGLLDGLYLGDHGASEGYGEPPEIPKGDRIMAAFCRGGRMFSYLGATLADIDSPDDPRFRNLIGVATRQLFPFRDPTRDGRNKDDLMN